MKPNTLEDLVARRHEIIKTLLSFHTTGFFREKLPGAEFHCARVDDALDDMGIDAPEPIDFDPFK